MSDAVEALRRCTPSRRSLKFRPGQYARHFLAFDASISRESRMLLYMRIFAFSSRLVDTDILPQYQAATYFPEEALEVRIVTDCRHPAYGQAGLYAKRTIPSNVVVVPYSGFLEIFSTSSNSRTYTMGFGSINDDYALDAEFAGNYGRFANDPRGVDGLQANLGAESRFSARGEAYTALVSRRQILKGEELLMAYGKAHSLSSSAWANVKGDFVLRPRLGGVVPVPSLHPTVTSNSTSTGDNSGSGTATDYHVMWECTQCGMWNGEEHPGAPTLPRCCFCTSPRLSGARMATVLSPPVPSPQVLLLDTLGSQEAIDEARKRCRVDESYVEPLSKVEPIDKGAVGTKSRQTTIYDSTAVDWPLNVPFLSWQVWDPSVPVTAIIKHSRFEVHEHVLLYNIIHNANDEEDGDGDPASPANGEGSGSTRSRVQPNRRRNPRASKRTRNNTTEVLWKRLDTKEEPPLRGAPRRPRDVNCSRPSILDRLLSTQDAEGWLPLRHLCSEEQNMSECAVSDLHQRLQNLNRRPFSGKSFEAGEQVAVLGGTIRLAADLRCRPDGSPLSIPLHHLAPRSWRKALQKHAGEGDVALTEANRFIRSLEELALVVTNELMFCPVIGIVDECSCHSSDCACQLESLLKEACNVVVILTIDSLGNPYVAAVASRHIGAFEPLLARTQ